ncbi:MAG: heme ABC exporter ATP-binding protein CcmA [Xanthobacteraceae bacterium]|nr:heme ABC exporter ATP-binding protein CcmA [Xanthobacteraceae bacterium]
MRLLVEGLACVRGGRSLFQGLGFAVTAGEVLAVTGPNGAGKSSLLRLLAGLLPPAAGRIALEGGDPEQSVGTAAHFIGHLDAVKGALTVAENLGFTRALLGGGEMEAETALGLLGLERLAQFPARMLSAGQRRRLALARLLVSPRPLWLLDEPSTALDAEGQETLASLMTRHLSGGGLAVVATHSELKIERVVEIRLGLGGIT